MDLAPTILDAAAIQYPSSWKGNNIHPLEGRSVLGYTGGRQEEVHDSNYAFGMEHSGYTMFRKGEWKINNNSRPFDENQFELYRLSTDLAEKNNLREEFPDKFEELLRDWRLFIQDKRVQLPR
jgi:arylsulfatase